MGLEPSELLRLGGDLGVERGETGVVALPPEADGAGAGPPERPDILVSAILRKLALGL